MADLLELRDLTTGYGDAVVIRNLSLRLAEGEALAVLGRNGVGKTTLLDSIIGVTRRFGGTVTLSGADLTRAAPEARAAAGIGWVPQERNIFRSLTVEENLTATARPGQMDAPPCLRDVSPAGGTPRQPGQPVVGRGAADAGRGPGADAQPARAAPR